MKKLILTVAIAALSLNLISCSGKVNNEAKETNAKPESSQSENQTPTSVKTFLGQVSGKVGNDIILSLGTFVLDNDESTSESVIYDGTGEPRPYDEKIDGEGSGEVLMIPMPDDENDDSGDSNTSTSEPDQLPIEFTGEVREFTIPAGAKITNVMGKEVNFDTVKKGSLVQIIVNESTNVVESLMVW